ncbi:hypothetical protein LTR96_000007 [Exophiala xenobiotica]|nr:hypothetical protein LTR96_000007 [Exophiala xenobiotica]
MKIVPNHETQANEIPPSRPAENRTASLHDPSATLPSSTSENHGIKGSYGGQKQKNIPPYRQRKKPQRDPKTAIDPPAGYHIILLHDAGSSGWATWQQVAHRLKTFGYDTIALDLPAHGCHIGREFIFAVARHDLRSKTRRLRVVYKYKPTAPSKVVLVGIGLGAQVALDFTSDAPQKMAGIIVSGASIHPPDDAAGWELETKSNAMQKHVDKMGVDAFEAVQAQSQSFKYVVPNKKKHPPVLVMRGEHDVPMATRDFEEIYDIAKGLNDKSDKMILRGARHNHAQDIPEHLADLIDGWVQALPKFSTPAASGNKGRHGNHTKAGRRN